MITALIFDLDGTIGDTEELHFQAWQKALFDHGVPQFTFDDFMRYVGTSNEKVANDYCSSYNIHASEIELIKYKQNLYLELIPKVHLCKGAKELIELCAPHYAMAVASSSHQKEVRKILEGQGLLQHFQAVLCGDMVTKRKPDPEIYLRAAHALNEKPENCMAFEDTEHGLNAAKAAGMYGVAIPTPFSKNHDFSAANTLLQSLSEMNLQIIRGIK